MKLLSQVLRTEACLLVQVLFALAGRSGVGWDTTVFATNEPGGQILKVDSERPTRSLQSSALPLTLTA